MAMPATQRRWTAPEVRQLIAESPLQTPRYELVDGELLVTPSPNEPHQRAVFLLVRALGDYLERNPLGQVYTSPFDVELEAKHPIGATEPFRLDLPTYFAAVFGAHTA